MKKLKDYIDGNFHCRQPSYLTQTFKRKENVVYPFWQGREEAFQLIKDLEYKNKKSNHKSKDLTD